MKNEENFSADREKITSDYSEEMHEVQWKNLIVCSAASVDVNHELMAFSTLLFIRDLHT
jgi:hypothetical protein